MRFELTYITAIGFAAQLLFSARLIVQWLRSEKAGRVLTPVLFWQLSILASFLLFVYGILRNDFAIILGQVFSYFIYIRNLQIKDRWRQIPFIIRLFSLLTPFLTVGYGVFYFEESLKLFLQNPDIPLKILIWGSFGQVVFTLRFVYQWGYSEKIQSSVLPLGFWIISLIGSLLIISYGIYRLDLVLVLGQAFGLLIYTRNIILIFRNKRFELQENA